MKTLSRKRLVIAVATLNLVAFPLLAPQNRAPVANPDSFTMNANTTLSVLSPGVLANDTDQDGDPLTAVLASSVSHGALTFNANGSFNYTPANNFTNGTDSFIYQASDGQLPSVNATVTITINPPVNHPPGVLDLQFLAAANKSTTFTFACSNSCPLSLTDVDGDRLTYRFIQLPSHGHATLNLIGGSGGTIASWGVIYTPDTNFMGTDTLTYVANDGKVDSNVGTLTVNVVPSVSINNVSVLEGNTETAATFTISLSLPSTETVTVNFATQDGTATSNDYKPRSGTLTFLPGVQQQSIRVVIAGDTLFERDETFFVFLSHKSSNVVIGNPRFGTGTILNDDKSVGVTEGIPPEALVKVGERFTYGIQWTHPVRWRLLDTVDIRIIDDEDSVLNVRFDEADNTFSLFNPANGKFLHPDAPGSRTHFETDAAVMYLENSQVLGSGPTGPSVLLNLNLSFKPKAAGRVFRVEAFATDDDGNQQGFDEAGIIGVLRK